MTLSRPASFAILASVSLLAITSNLTQGCGADKPSGSVDHAISKAASDSCSAKVKRLEDYAATADPKKGQTTKFSESEINSFLAFELSEKYHPSLKSLIVTLEESKLSGSAAIDFDVLGMSSKSALSKLFAKLFAGLHTLTVKGKLLASGGKGSFQLDEARFDETALPNFIVEEVITAVGRKQKPPFDPMQPSQLPYAIDRVDLYKGYILVHQ